MYEQTQVHQAMHCGGPMADHPRMQPTFEHHDSINPTIFASKIVEVLLLSMLRKPAVQSYIPASPGVSMLLSNAYLSRQLKPSQYEIGLSRTL